MTTPPPVSLPPELRRPMALERIPPHGLQMVVTATPPECAALAARLRILGVRALSCRFQLHKLPAGEIAAQGELRARIVQTCIVSLDDFTANVTESFRILFVPAGKATDEAELLSSDIESDDEIPYEGVFIDLGEAVAEQLALALDPYPRKPGAVLPEDFAGPDTSPFSVLGALRPKN